MLDTHRARVLSTGYVEDVTPAIEAEAVLLEAALTGAVLVEAPHGVDILLRLILDARHAEHLVGKNPHILIWSRCDEARVRLGVAIIAAYACIGRFRLEQQALAPPPAEEDNTP